MKDLEHCFHTFSLEGERAYAPTNDVVFVSENDHVEQLKGGVERAVEAVLHIPIEATVIRDENLRHLINTTVEEMIAIPENNLVRKRSDLEVIYLLSQAFSDHQH